MSKFILTSETKVITGITLYRIKALKDFSDVKKGETGGFLGKIGNLSQFGKAWVYDDAMVYGDAKVYADAWVLGNAEVYGNAQVYDNARVFDRALVCGYARVLGHTYVYDNTKVYGNAIVYGKAEVYGNACVFGSTRVYSNAKVYGNAKVSGNANVFDAASLSAATSTQKTAPKSSNNSGTTSASFKVGDKVRIKKNSSCYNGGIHNPKDADGEIVSLESSIYKFKVNWSNGETGRYRYEDLEYALHAVAIAVTTKVHANTSSKFDKLHWANGGHGVTNFDSSKKDLYEQAIKQFGDPDLHVGPSIEPLKGCFALYDFKGGRDLSVFWNIYDKVNLTYKDGVGFQQDSGSKTQVHICSHDWVETQGLFNSYKDCKKCGAKWEDVQ